MGGELVRLGGGDVEYNGGICEIMSIERGMKYEEFIAKACQELNITTDNLRFTYTIEYDRFVQIPLRNDEDFAKLVRFCVPIACVYITRMPHSEVVDGSPQFISRNDCHVVATPDIPCSPWDAVMTMQSVVASQRCSSTSNGPLHSAQFKNAIIGSGQIFESMKGFREAIYLLSIAGRFRYKFKRNSPKHTTIVCNVENCPWKVTTRVIGATQMVQVFTFINTHNHSVDDAMFGKPMFRTKHGGALIDEVIKSTPDYLPRQLDKDFERQYGMHLSYAQAWNLKERSKERIHGCPYHSYKLLPWMCQRLKELNPETIVEYRCDSDGHFVQLFVALAVSIHGFNVGCRSIIVIDSSHMSGPYKGVMFSASTYDADDGLFPLAYALFCSENYEDWLWFLQHLKIVISNREVAIILDRHQGIIRSVAEVFGPKFNAYCYHHVKENFSSFLSKSNVKGRKGKDNALQMLDKVAYAQLETKYVVALDTLRTFNPNLAKWVEDNSPEHWVMSKYPKMRWDKMTNNLAESFNSWMRQERHHNISVFFIKHMDKVGSLFAAHQNEIQIWNGCFGPKTQERIASNIARGETYITHAFLAGLIKVTVGFAYHEVDLKNRTCSCRSWQMSDIPCDHACAAIRRVGADIADFVDDWFKLNTQELIFSGELHSLLTHDMPTIHEDGTVRDVLGYVFPSIEPPCTRRPPSRPRK